MIQPPERICRYCGYWHQRYAADMSGECGYVLVEFSRAWVENEAAQLCTSHNFSCAAWQQRESNHDPAA